MVLRMLGKVDSTFDPQDWTTGIDVPVLWERLEAIKTFVGCFGISVPEAIKILKDTQACQSSEKKNSTTNIPSDVAYSNLGLRRYR